MAGKQRWSFKYWDIFCFFRVRDDGRGYGASKNWGFKFEEAEIFKQIYLVEYYKKKTRAILKNIDSAVDFITLRDGDSTITRTNKNEIAKTYRGLAKDAQEHLEKLTAKYNIYGAAPVQVAGTDAPDGTGEANYVLYNAF